MPRSKARLAKLVSNTIPLEEVASAFGTPVAQVREDLKRQGVPVIGDRVHVDVLEKVMRGERVIPKAVPSGEDDVRLVREQIAPYGLDVTAADEGRSLTLQLAATRQPRLLYSSILWKPTDEDPDTAFRPVRVTKQAPCLARVYTATKIQAGAARFAASGYFRKRAPDIYLFLLRDPLTLWSANAAELRAFEEVALASDDDDERSPSEGYRFGFIRAPGKLRKGRRDGLRLWMTRKPCELSLEGRVHTSRHRLVTAGGEKHES